MDGVSAIAELARRQVSRARVLVLTTYDTDSDVLPAIEAGATGYLLKDAATCRAAARRPRGGRAGETVLAPSVATRLVTRSARRPEPLSPAGA